MTLEPVNTYDSTKLPFEQHALALHPPEDSKAAAKYVKESLDRGQLTVYVPINTGNNASHISAIASSGIVNYEESVNQGNLLTFDTSTFYNAVLAGNVQPFEELKVLLEEAIRERIASSKNDEVTVVSGIAGSLASNQKFDESINLEEWWEKTHSEWLQNGLKVTLICSHPRTIFNESQFMHYKQAMSSLHHIVAEVL